MKHIKYQAAIPSPTLSLFRDSILVWYRRYGRDLPWRHTRDPYKILVSEILLHQTTVRSVLPVFEAFLARFPTLESCAAGPLSAIKEITDPLGYKVRGSWLYDIAVHVMQECDGVFPDTLDGLLALPGVGRYTAGAVLSFAFEQDAPILDTNVNRLLGRFFGVDYKDHRAEIRHELWALAEAIVPPGQGADFNQALMDMGALVCTAKKPLCLTCPIYEGCAMGSQDEGTHAAEARVSYAPRAKSLLNSDAGSIG